MSSQHYTLLITCRADFAQSLGWMEEVERDYPTSNKCVNSLDVMEPSSIGSVSATARYSVKMRREGHADDSLSPLNGHPSNSEQIFSYDRRELMMSGIPDRPGQTRDFSIYGHRLSTFQDGPLPWSRAAPSAHYLAKTGFFYTGYEQVVKCFACDVEISDWGDGKDALIKHHYKNPYCKFIHQDFSSELKVLLSRDRFEHRSPHYSSSSYRLHSFSNWQFTDIVTSYQLASAGFFFTGSGSRVECFSCGLVVEDWKKSDLPLHIHRQRRPNCSFITSLLTKDSHKSLDAASLPATPSDYPASRLPDYSNLSVRVRSFKHLARDFPVSGELCAAAGLFLLRKPDVMKCFSCGAVVRDWVLGDVPAEKHRETNSNCKFLHEFFPTKLTEEQCVGQSVSTAEQEGIIDPNTLPEPEFDEAELERMSLEQKAKNKLTSDEYLSHTLSQVSLSSPVEEALRPHPAPTSTVSSLAFTLSTYKCFSCHFLQLTQATEHSSSDSTCVVCMDAPLQVVLIPCGHLCVCENCSRQIFVCPMCRRNVDDVVKVYLP